MTSTPARYEKPGWFTRNVFNPLVTLAVRAGLSVRGARVLQVRGRTSGELREVPVNVLTLDGERYLVSPRGTTQWVRNLRVAGEGTLRAGRRTEPFRAVELADGDKPPMLRAYLRRWKFEVGAFFEGVDADASDEEFAAIAANHPVFRIEEPPATTG